MKTYIVRLAGMVLFAAAFFMPAVRGTGTGPGNGSMDGWMCATFAGAATGAIFHVSAATLEEKNVPGMIFLILSGWVNPFVMMYLVLCIWPQLVRIRRTIGVAVLVCMAATWVFLAIAQMRPLIGHFVWVGGMLMILAGEVTRRFATEEAKELKMGGTVQH